MQVKLSNGMMMGSFTMGIGVAKLRLSDGGLASLVDANFVREGRYIDPFLYGGKIRSDDLRYGCSVIHYIEDLHLQGSGHRDDRGRDLLLKVKVNQAQTSQVTRLRD